MTAEPPATNLDLELLAAQLRRHSEDLSLYAGFLLTLLSSALPGELIAVGREGKLKARLAGREPAVLSVSVTIGDRRYDLARAEWGAPATAKICHQSGGVVLSTRQVSADEWAQGLAAALVTVAGGNAAAAAALARLTSS
jgi:hypothetical protein